VKPLLYLRCAVRSHDDDRYAGIVAAHMGQQLKPSIVGIRKSVTTRLTSVDPKTLIASFRLSRQDREILCIRGKSVSHAEEKGLFIIDYEHIFHTYI